MSGIFISGTDTEVGKTTCSVALLRQLRQQGYKVAAMKPIASGCEPTESGLRNADALALMQQASVQLPYELVNPYSFEEPIAPHIAAKNSGCEIRIDTIVDHYQQIASQVDVVIVEGVGGWMVPLGNEVSMVDLARALALPTVLVCGIRLGCLNHSLLSARSIEADGIQLCGWIANRLATDTAYAADNISYLQTALKAPYLGTIPYPLDESQSYFDLNPLKSFL